MNLDSERQPTASRRLIAMPEEKIDTSDIPELPPGAWKKAVRGKWYRPVKLLRDISRPLPDESGKAGNAPKQEASAS